MSNDKPIKEIDNILSRITLMAISEAKRRSPLGEVSTCLKTVALTDHQSIIKKLTILNGRIKNSGNPHEKNKERKGIVLEKMLETMSSLLTVKDDIRNDNNPDTDLVTNLTKELNNKNNGTTIAKIKDSVVNAFLSIFRSFMGLFSNQHAKNDKQTHTTFTGELSDNFWLNYKLTSTSITKSVNPLTNKDTSPSTPVMVRLLIQEDENTTTLDTAKDLNNVLIYKENNEASNNAHTDANNELETEFLENKNEWIPEEESNKRENKEHANNNIGKKEQGGSSNNELNDYSTIGAAIESTTNEITKSNNVDQKNHMGLPQTSKYNAQIFRAATPWISPVSIVYNKIPVSIVYNKIKLPIQ